MSPRNPSVCSAEQFTDVLVTSPNFVLFDIDVEKGAFIFLPMTEESLRREPFLDARIASRFRERYSVRTDSLVECFKKHAPLAKTPRHLFHTGFCGSTLLANCLDALPACLAYKEPNSLFSLCKLKTASLSGGTATTKKWHELIKMAIFFLSKTFTPTERALIKHSPMNSFALNEFVAASPKGKTRGIFLYSDLKTFLSSVFQAGNRRNWCRHYASILPSSTKVPDALARISVNNLSDAETAAYVWGCQIRAYLDFVKSSQAKYVKALNCEVFFNEPGKTLAKAADFLDFPSSKAGIKKIVEGEVFTTYSKSLLKIKYTRSDREAILKGNAAKYADEIDAGLKWGEKITRKLSIPLVLPNSLAL